MTEYRLVAEPAADADVEAVFGWYENERPGLELEFLDELRAAYGRIVDGPFKYRDLRSEVRRALLRRFPYAVYFAVGESTIVVLAYCTRIAIQPRGRGREANTAMQLPGVAGS